jgi:hypothetical protein
MSSGLRRLKGLIIHRSMVREKDMIIEAFTREEGRGSVTGRLGELEHTGSFEKARRGVGRV